MRRLALAIVSLAVLAPAAHAEQGEVVACGSLHDYHVLARSTFRHSVGGHGGDFHARPVRRRNLHRLAAMRACWKPEDRAVYRSELRYFRTARAHWREYRHLDRITACGEWVVCGVVDNESATSGYYRAVNSGGCSGNGCFGAYQASGMWWRSRCSRLNWRIPADQHRCAYIILRTQGLGAWAGDGAYL